MAVFWVVAPCSLVEVYQRFRGPCCLHHQGDRPDGRQYNPEDSHLRTHRRENLKSYLKINFLLIQTYTGTAFTTKGYYQ
jgi:hypothetical protein